MMCAFLRAQSHGLLDLGDSLAGVEALGARASAVENGVAAVEAHRVLKLGLALSGALVA